MLAKATNSGAILLNGGSDSSVRPPQDAAWDILEQFIRTLQACENLNEQIRLTLNAILDSLQADVVFWYPGASRESMEMVGDPNVSPEWCKGFADRFFQENQIVDSFLVGSALQFDMAGDELEPTSVVMVQLSRTKCSWLVALSFNPERRFQDTDVKILSLAKRMLLNQRQQTLTHSKLKDTLFGLIRSLTATIDAKDPYTCGHSERVARIASRIGEQMELPAEMLSDLYLAGLLHDIGKIGIEDRVLRKPDKLTDEEFDHIKQHPVIGDRIISNIKQLEHLRPGVRNHHERYDGDGYPDGLKGEEIPLMARILAVADSYDAMMSSRPYRQAMPAQKLERLMVEGAGTQWDPLVIAHFMECKDELLPICQHGIGHSVYVAVERAATMADPEISQRVSRS